MMDARNWLLDHTGIGVADIVRSARFYETTLATLGMRPLLRLSRTFQPAMAGDADLAAVGFGVGYPVFWIDLFHPHSVKQHTAFRAVSRDRVDAFYREGLAAGGIDNGAPGLRGEGYPPCYYAAFLLDPDGNNIESVCRET